MRTGRNSTRGRNPMVHPRRHALLLPMHTRLQSVRTDYRYGMRFDVLERLPMVFTLLTGKDDLLPGARLALDDGGVGWDDERVLGLGRVEELAVAAVPGRFRAAGAAVSFVEPDDEADDPGDADYAPRDGAGVDWGERALAGGRRGGGRGGEGVVMGV